MDNSGQQVPRPEREDEIDLLEIIGIVWAYRYLIIGLTSLGVLAAFAYTILSASGPVEESSPVRAYQAQTSIYFPLNPTSESHLGIVGEQIFHSSGAYRHVTDEFDGFEAGLKNRERFSELLETELDRGAGLLVVNFFHPDEALSENILKELLKFMESRFVEMEQEQSYMILDGPAVIGSSNLGGESGSGHDRSRLIFILAVVVSFMGAFFIAFLLNFIRRVKNDPESMRKLKGEF